MALVFHMIPLFKQSQIFRLKSPEKHGFHLLFWKTPPQKNTKRPAATLRARFKSLPKIFFLSFLSLFIINFSAISIPRRAYTVNPFLFLDYLSTKVSKGTYIAVSSSYAERYWTTRSRGTIDVFFFYLLLPCLPLFLQHASFIHDRRSIR